MTTASGTLTYTSALTPADAEIGGPLYPTSIGSRSIYTTKPNPYTGRKIEGWKWDERIWPDEHIENISEYVPSLWDATTSGITETSFQSGIGDGDDLRVQEVKSITSSGIQNTYMDRLWAPVLNHGYYYKYADEGYLFSDASQVETPTISGFITGLSTQYNTMVLS